MQQFIANHGEQVTGVLSGFDRLAFRGTLRVLSKRGGLMTYLSVVRVLLVDFAGHALKLTQQLKDASLSRARQTGRPVQYLTAAAHNKEEIVYQMTPHDEHHIV